MHKYFKTSIFSLSLVASSLFASQNLDYFSNKASELLDDKIDLDEFKFIISNALDVAQISDLRVDEGTLQNLNSKMELEDSLFLLPELLRKNVSLKHGLKLQGLRGHGFDKFISQSADILYPRVVLWDEENGLSFSWNGGVLNQTAGDRIDVLGYDHEKQSYYAHALKFPIEINPETRQYPYHEVDSLSDTLSKDMKCVSCHGDNLRPIWNMYPDWTSFYASDNDEIAFSNIDAEIKEAKEKLAKKPDDRELKIKLAQLEAKKPYVMREGKFYLNWRKGVEVYETSKTNLEKAKLDFVALKEDTISQMKSLNFSIKKLKKIKQLKDLTFEEHIKAMKRYAPLTKVLDGKYYKEFASSFLNEQKEDAKKHFPFRPSNALDIKHQSRSFFFRPNLRLGILYNRINAKFVYNNYLKEEFSQDPLIRDVFLHSALDCSWDDLSSGFSKVRGDLNLYEKVMKKYNFTKFKSPTGRHRIHFLELLEKFEHRHTKDQLDIRDYDIRSNFKSKSYHPYLGKKKLKTISNSVMGLSYYQVGTDDKALSYSSREKFNKLLYKNNDYYFNSYWDGSATINEYISALIVHDNPEYKDEKKYIRTFQMKYGKYFDRFNLDKKYFYAMDRILSEDSEEVVGWIPAPYPNDIGAEHHRESFRDGMGYRVYDFYSDLSNGRVTKKSSSKISSSKKSVKNYKKLCRKIKKEISRNIHSNML